MKTQIKIRQLTLKVFSAFFLTFCALGAGKAHSFHNDLIESAQTHPKGIFVFATGPDLGANNSETVRVRTQTLADCLKDQLPEYQFHVFEQFMPTQLDKFFKDVAHLYGQQTPVTLIINSHGYDKNNTYFMKSHEGLVDAKTLSYLLHDCNVNVALLTCHSGAAVLDGFKGQVFGSSSNLTLTKESHFRNWIEIVKETKCPLLSAEQFCATWEEAVKRSGSSSKDYPCWYAKAEAGKCKVVYGVKEMAA